ncbi:MAG: endonuclease/exonuclease/phosphatase family protein [Lachnospiraceae bacterium]|nr:endonuclease/exonuclease/phosphatase family protein [Lachnospiraceae bacterium]
MSRKFGFLTFNISFRYGEDGINSFVHRAGMILERIYAAKPDVICLQEATPKIMGILRNALQSDYDIIHLGREADLRGEGLAIFCRHGSVEFQTVERFWLSPTPLIPGSRYDCQKRFVRITEIALLYDVQRDRFFRLYNNHFDNTKLENGDDTPRIQSMQQILEHLRAAQEITELPFFICGDLNEKPDGEAIRYANAYEPVKMTDVTKDLEMTSHSFEGLGIRDQKIDYIFTDKETAAAVKHVEIWDDVRDGIWLSDHFPVFAEFEFS